jgi:predicted DNA-binding protein
MALSVRLNPDLEARIAAESRRRGLTKSEIVKDALERVLGDKNPYALLKKARSGASNADLRASENTGQKLRAKLRAKRPA